MICSRLNYKNCRAIFPNTLVIRKIQICCKLLKFFDKNRFLDTCECIFGEDFHSYHDLIQSYTSFIDQLLTQITPLSLKFNQWWSFKPNSLLRKYLLEHEITLEIFFTFDALSNALNHLFDLRNLAQENNKDIIVLDSPLQLCFQSFMIYKPFLYEACKHLIQRAPPEIETKLKNEKIFKHLSITCPKTIIYKDPTSLFYLYPPINKLMETGQHVFKWKELSLLFQDFCTSHPEHFSRQLDFMEVKKDSPWASFLPFHYFHIHQCEAILKRITKYLGRKSFATYSCPNFQKPLFPNLMFNEIISLIEDKIDEKILPQYNVNISL